MYVTDSLKKLNNFFKRKSSVLSDLLYQVQCNTKASRGAEREAFVKVFLGLCFCFMWQGNGGY